MCFNLSACILPQLMELKAEEKLKTAKAEAEMSVKAVREKVSKLTAAKKEASERLKGANKRLEATRSDLASAVEALDCKEQQLELTVQMANSEIAGYKEK